MNHTPTPWDFRSRSITVKDNGEDIVAEANGGLSGTIGEAVANAAFIVRACNAHEALVKAATDLLAYLPASSDGFQVKLEDVLVEALQFAGADIKVTTGE